MAVVVLDKALGAFTVAVGTEKMGFYEISTLIKTNFVNDEPYLAFEDKSGTSRYIMIPDRAVSFHNDVYGSAYQYLVSGNNWRDYVQDMQDAGYEFDQMGAAKIFENESERIVWELNMYTGFCYRIRLYL